MNAGAFAIPVLHEITLDYTNVLRIHVAPENDKALISQNRMHVISSRMSLYGSGCRPRWLPRPHKRWGGAGWSKSGTRSLKRGVGCPKLTATRKMRSLRRNAKFTQRDGGDGKGQSQNDCRGGRVRKAMLVRLEVFVRESVTPELWPFHPDPCRSEGSCGNVLRASPKPISVFLGFFAVTNLQWARTLR